MFIDRIWKDMDRIGLFPGTFDPVTLGHVDVIHRLLPMVDVLYIGVGVNAEKATMFPVKQRLGWLEQIFVEEQKVKVKAYEGLTVDFCKQIGAGYIVRGIRTVKDFEYEKAIADMNAKLAKNVDTLFLFASPEFGTLASTLVRDVIRNGGDVSSFLPQVVLENLRKDQFLQT